MLSEVTCLETADGLLYIYTSDEFVELGNFTPSDKTK